MRHLHFLVEGATEALIVREVLAPELTSAKQYVSQSSLDGVSRWPAIHREIRQVLRDPTVLLTTLIDYHGFPADAPGMNSRPASDALARVRHVERALAVEVGSSRFLPHLTLHETEAWVFAAPEQIAIRFEDLSLESKVAKIVAAAGGPESINDSYETTPSRQLTSLIPVYTKVADGLRIIRTAGLDVVLTQCPHARAWFESLRA